MCASRPAVLLVGRPIRHESKRRIILAGAGSPLDLTPDERSHLRALGYELGEDEAGLAAQPPDGEDTAEGEPRPAGRKRPPWREQKDRDKGG